MDPSVLIVDDSLTVRMDLEEAFSSSGFRTTLCAGAADARRELTRQAVDLILLDVLMPGEGGLELLRDLRRQPTTASVPIILMSSEAEVSDRIRGLDTGATDFVGKPYDRAYLVARARELVRRSVGAASPEAGTSVLVIDDSATVRAKLGEVLEREGFGVIEAATGEEGLEVAVAHRPAAAIVDAVLPGIDGAAVVRQLRGDAILRRTPCIMLTSADGPGGELQALENGADAYVRKDEGLEVVLARLRALLRAGPGMATLHIPGVLGPKRILAVDDSTTFLHELADQLGNDGFELVQATSGEEALRLLARQEVDCVLMDLTMPGMSGQEACRAIKADPRCRAVPLIVVTAREGREAMIEAIEAGADDFVPKSSQLQVLRARVRAQLRRKQFEREGRALADHERFEQASDILETVPDAFFAIDASASILYANSPALELIGRRREQARGASLWEGLAHLVGPSFRSELERALASPAPSRFLDRFRSAGEPTYEVRVFPRQGDFIVYLRDVSDRVAAEDALREVDRRKDEFLALLSHELRNPLAPIRNSLYILDRAAPASEHARRARDTIDRQVHQLVRLVDDLLDVTRIARGKIQVRKGRLELGDLVRRAIDDHRASFAENGVEVEVHIEGAWWVDGDATRLAQVVGNLLHNASKFTDRGGKVTVSMDDAPPDRVALRVRDDGVGIDPALLPRLFQPFAQGRSTLARSMGGLGLGLALVKGLVEEHGGSVSAASDGPGAGSEFTIRLPVERRPEPESRSAPAPLEPGAQRARVLVIDDNVDEADSLRDALELGGHAAEAAYGGPEGLDKARSFRPDVIFCDIGMPRMDGYALARAIRADPALAPIRLVALSGYARPEDARKAREAGFDHHLAKPASIDELDQTIRSGG